jgi:hypothetical protein
MPVIHTFTSTNGSGLSAFTGDSDGRQLPARHGPWKHMGSVQPNRDLPHKLDRSIVEAAIETHGFQMWRPRRVDV